MSRASERGPRGNARADRGRARERGRAPRRRARILEVVVWASVTIIARASNRFIVLHLAITPGIIRAPVNGSIRGRKAPPRAWIEVNLAAVVENARTVARVAGTRLLPVVKANAYGVGAVPVSKALEAVDPWGYGVATVDEGAELRAAGITRPVVVFMPGHPGLFDELDRFRLTPVLGDAQAITEWTARGERPFHLEIDTGMGRSGVRWDEIDTVRDAANTPHLEGCYTQFHSADRRGGSVEGPPAGVGRARARVKSPPALPHVGNSATALSDRGVAVGLWG